MTGQQMTTQEVISQVEKDRDFYDRSRGGLTLSGGDPLSQSEFAESLFRESQRRGISTVLDTCGHAPWQDISRLLDRVDLVLYDIKHLELTTHQKLTGVSNQTILANARRIAASGKPMMIRVPVVPGFNDSRPHIRAIGELAAELKAREIALLPYHRLTEAKYQRLGRAYPLMGMEPPSQESMEKLRQVAGAAGVPAQIGG